MNKLPTSSWSKFRIGALFFSQNGNVDIQKIHINGKGNWVVSSGLANAGIIGRSDIPAKVFTPETITIDMFGNVFYRSYPYKMVTHARVFSLSVRDESITLNKGTGLFLSASLAFLNKMFSFSNMCTYDKIVDIDFCLPIQTDSEGKPLIDPERKYHAEGYIPDWNYMQERIAELEQERIAELEQYLVAAGLNDYELNDEDKAALISSKNMADFNLSILFNISKGKRLTKKDQTKGNTPFIGSCDSNNGVTGYIGQPPLFEENAITISYNGSVGQVFYQEKPFWASDDINVLYLKNHTLNRDLFGYLGAALSKVGKQFSYTYKWNLARMKRSAIKLPIQTNEEGSPILDPERKYHAKGYIPDWEYMTAYIRAMKKVVIADVVKYKDEVIAKTRALVSAK